MSLVDVIIVFILLIIVSIVVYFAFIKNKDNPCKGCPYYKNCNKSKCDKK